VQTLFKEKKAMLQAFLHVDPYKLLAEFGQQYVEAKMNPVLQAEQEFAVFEVQAAHPVKQANDSIILKIPVQTLLKEKNPELQAPWHVVPCKK
jgi:hypothetical protein